MCTEGFNEYCRWPQIHFITVYSSKLPTNHILLWSYRVGQTLLGWLSREEHCCFISSSISHISILESCLRKTFYFTTILNDLEIYFCLPITLLPPAKLLLTIFLMLNTASPQLIYFITGTCSPYFPSPLYPSPRNPSGKHPLVLCTNEPVFVLFYLFICLLSF